MPARRGFSALLFATLAGPVFCGALPAQTPPRKLVVVLIGPAGSGKTTQAAYLQRKYGLPAITVEDLIQRNPAALARYRTPGIRPGSPQSSDALNDLVAHRLSLPDVKNGFVLDGYPATKDQADHLERLVKSMGLPSPLIVQLDIPDAVARERLKKGRRAADKPSLIEERLKDYHREMDLIRDYYPEANLWTIDGSRTPAEVSKTIDSIVKDEAPRKP